MRKLFRTGVPFPDFSTLYTLGVGSSSTVNLVEHCPSGARMAVKIKSLTTRNQRTNEVEIMHGLDFPFICRMFDAAETDSALFVALEYSGGGNLLNFISRNGRLSGRAIRFLAGEVLSALAYLHIEKRIAHLDIKTENILLDANNTIRLADFGLSTFDGDSDHAGGSVPYAAPEVVRGEKPGFLSDIWSFGVVLYCAAVGQFPFCDADLGVLFDKIVKDEVVYPQFLDADLKDLLGRMLVKDPSRRISLAGIREHPFLAEFDFELLSDLMATPRRTPGSSLVDKIRAREEEMVRYRDFGIVEASDAFRTEQTVLDQKLATLNPFATGMGTDPFAGLAKRVASGKRGRRKGS
jgi:serine/threonine protein kinase